MKRCVAITFPRRNCHICHGRTQQISVSPNLPFLLSLSHSPSFPGISFRHHNIRPCACLHVRHWCARNTDSVCTTHNLCENSQNKTSQFDCNKRHLPRTKQRSSYCMLSRLSKSRHNGIEGCQRCLPISSNWAGVDAPLGGFFWTSANAMLNSTKLDPQLERCFAHEFGWSRYACFIIAW